MAVKYIPYFPNTLKGQALLDNFVRTKRSLRYRDNNQIVEHIAQGMPYYEMVLKERIGENGLDENLVIRGECISACAYLKEKGIQVDLVYIDPPFASGADYAKKVYVRRNPRIAHAIAQTENALDLEDFKVFEEKMYGDVWDKERYLNWMYENLMAIKSIMSDNASIYVHLDWHISHYVKILMDEIFGEDNFRNEIAWHYSGWNKKLKVSFEKRHDTILYYCPDDEGNNFNSFFERYSSEEEYVRKRKQRVLIDEDGRKYVLSDAGGGRRIKRYLEDALREGVVVDDVWDLDKLNNSANESVDYATQKPEVLLERIISASSKAGMVVADFFGGSGVTAAVATKLGRRFIHADVNINSILTTRDRLAAQDAQFTMLEIKDGVSLYRNPVQTMDKLKSLIRGLRNEDSLDKFWEGSIVDTKYGMMPVYLPNLMDGTTRLLDKPLMNRIIREAMPELPENTKRVIVYYIDIIDREEIEKFIKEQNDRTTIEIELRDLKQILDDVVVEDEAQWHLEETQDNLWSGWKVFIDTFHSDRVLKKIEEVNFKGEQQAIQQKAKGKEKEFKPIIISDEGLETIEWLSVDCSTAEKDAPWHSDAEIKIDRLGYVILNGTKTQDFWDGTVKCDQKPLRLKIRNICGDESTFVIQ